MEGNFLMNTFKNALIEYPLKENISVQTYEGYNSLHIDLMYKEETIIWLNLDKENKLKICKIKESVKNLENLSLIMETIIELAKVLNADEIFGRIDIDEKNILPQIFVDFGFSYKEKYDKEKRTAKIHLIL